MSPTSDARRSRLKALTEASVRTIVASEKAVEQAARRQFQDVRLVASLGAGLLLVGFLLVAQWRGVETYEEQLVAQTDQELALIVHELGTENDDLRRETLRLEQRIGEAERSAEGQLAVLNEAARELQSLRVLTGIEGATGPGIAFRIEDPQRLVLGRDLVDVVNELWAAGAEAISVDGVRVGATSAFTDHEDEVLLDGQAMRGDIVVFAIGDAVTLTQALEMPGGVASTVGSFPGVTVEVIQRDQVDLPPADIAAFEYGETFEG